MNRRASIGSSLLLGVYSWLGGCSVEAPEATGEVLAPTRFSPPQTAGAEACAECHASHVESWSRSGMARTLEVTQPPELEGLGVVSNPPSGFHYQFARTPGGGAHVLGELREDTPEFALGFEVLFGVGSGTRDRSYVIGRGAGMWFAPLEVLTVVGGRKAVLAPHASMKPGSRLSLAITAECLSCHTDSPPPRSFPLNLRPDKGAWSPRGISCAACHGNASEHAAWQLEGVSESEAVGSDPLLMHGDLTRIQQLSICAACHLQGDARILLQGRTLGPPPPGTDVLEQRAVFVAREASADVGFVSQVERLTLSRCFLQSQMTCSSCHDVHRSLASAGERARVRAACLNCHEPDEQATQLARVTNVASSAPGCSRPLGRGIETHQTQMARASLQDCVTCHMPETGVFDVAEITIHDHYIRSEPMGVRPAALASELRSHESATGDWRRFQWPGAEPPTHVEDPGLLMMAYDSAGHVELALEQVDHAVCKTVEALPMYHHLRAGLLGATAQGERARQSYERALQLDSEFAPSAINLGLLLGQGGELERGLSMLSGVIDRHPMAWSALRNRAVLHAGVGNLAGARADLESAFAALPDAAVARALEGLCSGSGDSAGAARWRGLAAELASVESD